MPPFPSPAPPSTDSPAAVTASLLSGSKSPAHLAAASVESPSEGAVGRLDEAHYERLMPPWRFRIRQKLVRSLEWEMEVLQGIQVRFLHSLSFFDREGAELNFLERGAETLEDAISGRVLC